MAEVIPKSGVIDVYDTLRLGLSEFENAALPVFAELCVDKV
jgi:hypothetical protein